MRKSKTIEGVVEGKSVEMQELRYRDVESLILRLDDKEENLTVSKIFKVFPKILEDVVNLNEEEIKELSFSEINALKKEFLEINSDFLQISKSLGLDLKKLSEEDS